MVAGQANPLPTEGVVGKLSPDQERTLKATWTELFRLVDAAPKNGSGLATGPPPTDKELAGGSIPKDDNAKEVLRAQRETADAQAAFQEYGSIKFMETFWRMVAMDDPDSIVLRFLRARKWSVTAGVAMLCACIKWRMSGDVEKIFEKGEEGMSSADGFIRQMEIGKTYTQGTDRYGRPVIYVHVAKHRTFDQSPKALEDFVIFQMESNRCLFAPPVDKIVMVFDMTGFGIRNMDWRCILFIVKCLEAYYPESLNVMLIHNAPWVFQGIWKLLGPMLDPVVRNKVEMTKNTDDLLVHIDKTHLVKSLGGASDWTWKYPPVVPGENAPQFDVQGRKKVQGERDALIREYQTTTRAWAASESLKATKQRELVVLKLRAQYFELDPYIRGRGAYHRNGNIVGNGLVFFEYPSGEEQRSEGEWEVQGYDTCREQALLAMAQTQQELKKMNSWEHQTMSAPTPTADFNANQLVVLSALCDAAFQGHEGTEAAEIIAAMPADAPAWQRARVETFVRSPYSAIPGAIDSLTSQFSEALSQTNVNALTMTLSLLSTRAGTLLLTGYGRPFPELTIKEREGVLQSWKESKILLLRKAFRGFVCIALFVAYTSNDEVPQAVGYPLGDPTRALNPERLRAPYPFVFETISTPYTYLNTDVLVIGSGAGGGVVSSEMSRKGWKTLVVEKGQFVKPQELTGTPREGLAALYENKGLMATEDGGVNVLAGSNFGGGTTVNWSASFRPPHYIRADWAKNHGLTHFLSREFTESMDHVCKMMGVSPDHIKHSKPNNILIDSSRKLGYHVDSIPQNTGGNEHSCGFCSFGCPYSEKQSGPVSWLRDAAEHGAKFLVDTSVERLLFASSSSTLTPTSKNLNKFTPTASRRRCIGALVKAKDGTLAIVRAKEAVVVSGGSLNSPAILLKSGLKGPRIGKNLRLHPTSYVTGYYDHTINPWEGSIMTAVSNVAENRDGTHHGIKLEVNMSFPGGTAASFQKWTSSKEHKKALIQFNNSFTLICIARDRGSGQIVLDERGMSRMDYSLDPYDGLSILEGILAAAEIHLAAGATRIVTAQSGVEDYYPAKGHAYLTDPKWLEWVAKVRKAGVAGSWTGLGSAHQMGSCQMGTKPSTSAVDPRGRVWGTEGLYVADASVFPTASAVNPMITNMSTAHSIAQFIDQDLWSAASKPTSAHL